MSTDNELTKLSTEDYYKYIWRIDGLIRSGKYQNWKDVTPIVNKNLWGDDEDKYRDESAYRKAVKYARDFYEAGVFGQSNSYIDKLEETKHELFKERQRLSDVRTSINKQLREDARATANYEILADMIKENAETTLPPTQIDHIMTDDKDMVILLSDLHIGLDVANSFGEYNLGVAVDRLGQLRDEIEKMQQYENCDNAYIVLIGDTISGSIHPTVRLENRENAIQQTQKAAEYLSVFTYEISKMFNTVYINSVSGNHSRIGLKDDVLRDERLDDIIPWYMRAKLSHLQNIVFLIDDNIDPTISDFEIRGNKVVAIHGDYDSLSEAGIAKLTMMVGYIPDIVLMGHLHQIEYQSISNVDVIRGGCLCGAIDNYSIQKRLNGKPSQVVFTVTKDGIGSIHPIILK